MIVPGKGDGNGSKVFLLSGAKDGARFDQANSCASEEIRHGARGTEEVGHQRAWAGTELDEIKGLRLSHRFETLHAPDADELSEHLGDFGSGGEVTSPAQRIASHIVAVNGVAEAQSHVAVERHGPGGLDHANELKLKGGWSGDHARRERISSQRPIRIIGRESIMPRVRNPASNPIWASGSRKNSTKMRTSP